MYMQIKNRTVPLLRRIGLTIASRELLRSGSIGSITYSGTGVNIYGVPFSDIVATDSYSMQEPGIDAQGDYSLMDTLLVDNTTKKAVSSIRPQTLSSFEPITASSMGSNSFSADRVPQTEPAVNTHSMQTKGENTQDGEHVNTVGYNKKEANRLLHRDGLQLPRRNPAVDFDTINVTQNTDGVNSYSMQEPEIDEQGDYSLMDTLLVDNTTKKAVVSQRPQTLGSSEPITASEMGSNSFSADRVPQTEPAVNSYSMQEPEIDAQGDYSLMDTDRRYTYDWLAKKPDMSVTVIDDESKYSATADGRKRLISDAIRNAKKIGKENSAGNAVIHVTDTDTDVTLSSRSLRHGLDRRFSVLAPVTENVGEILQNSVRINELVPSKDTVDSSYVLIGATKNKNNDPYIVQFVVNRSSNEVTSVDVLYSVNAKKEPAALLPKFTGAPATLTGSTISISNLLDYVNKYYPDILPEDVLRHYGHESRPDGKLGESALFSLMDTLPQEKPPQQETQQP